MNQIVPLSSSRTLGEITAEASVVYRRMEAGVEKLEADWDEFTKLMEEARPHIPHGQRQQYLKDHYPKLGIRQIYRRMELAKDKTKTIEQITHPQGRQMPVLFVSTVDTNEKSETNREGPHNDRTKEAKEFIQEVTRFKKEQESLYKSRAGFVLDRIKDLLQEGRRGHSLPDLMTYPSNHLDPAELDLTLEVIKACKRLALEAEVWEIELKEKHNV